MDFRQHQPGVLFSFYTRLQFLILQKESGSIDISFWFFILDTSSFDVVLFHSNL